MANLSMFAFQAIASFPLLVREPATFPSEVVAYPSKDRVPVTCLVAYYMSVMPVAVRQQHLVVEILVSLITPLVFGMQVTHHTLT